MSAGMLVAFVLGAGALAFVLAPLVRRDIAQAEQASSAVSLARELQSEREMLLAALKDLEDDRATDKIGDADYAALKAKLTERAIEVMRRINELGRIGQVRDRPRPARPR
jgi:hypothetical protein